MPVRVLPKTPSAAQATRESGIMDAFQKYDDWFGETYLANYIWRCDDGGADEGKNYRILALVSQTPRSRQTGAGQQCENDW